MTGRAWLWALAASGVAATIAAGLTSLLPAAEAPPPERLDVRSQLAERHARSVESVARVGSTAEPPVALTGEVLCQAPRAGRPVALDLGERGPALLLPCGKGAELWSASARPPTRLASLRWGAEALSLIAAEAADVDGDGALDLLLVLRSDAPERAHREGLYWLRGRTAGGYRRPVHLVAAPVVALESQAGESGASLWVLLEPPGPTTKPQLWHLSPGASPERTALWRLEGPAVDLARAGRGTDAVLWALSGDVAWVKPLDESPPKRGPELVGARGLLTLEGSVFAATDGGLRELRAEADGVWTAGPAEGPKGVESAVTLPSGWRFGVAHGELWSWRSGRVPRALRPAGGTRVEGVVAQAQGGWLWVSGLAGPQTAGVARLADPWPAPQTIQFLPRTPPEGSFPAVVSVP